MLNLVQDFSKSYQFLGAINLWSKHNYLVIPSFHITLLSLYCASDSCPGTGAIMKNKMDRHLCMGEWGMEWKMKT